MGLLNTDNTVFYTSSDDNYAVYAITTLLTIRDHLPDAELFLLSSGLSDNSRRLLEKNNIRYIEQDLSHLFTKTWEYPIDCFYLFSGPEIFLSMGFDYSVYVDGDILCMGDPLKEIKKIPVVAGVESRGYDGVYTSIFGDDWENIRREWSLPEETARRKRINAGVVYFNNRDMEKRNFLKTAADMFNACIEKGIPRKGDDSLFSLYQYVHLNESDVVVLPPKFNHVIQFNDNAPENDPIFFHFSVDKPWKRDPYKHEDQSQNIYNRYVRRWRQMYRETAAGSWLKGLKGFREIDIAVNYVLRVVDKFLRIFRDFFWWAQGTKKSLITRRWNTNKDPLKVYWWRDFDKNTQNFGDEITKDIINKLIGYRCELVSPDDAELFGVGSILEIAQEKRSEKKLHIWGSGFILAKDEASADIFQNTVFHAVRGDKTRQRISDDSRTVEIGDPGLLAGLVYEPSRYRANKVGVIAHYADADLPFLEKLKSDDRFLIINPLKPPAEVAKMITSCKLVLSSSLHGLIFADCYGVPNIHLKLSDRLKGGLYKFEDYYSALSLDYRSAEIGRVYDNTYHKELIDKYRQPKEEIRAVQRNLIKSFPRLR